METGTLADVSTAHLCSRLAADAATGCLRIQRDEMVALVFFRAGAVYTATAPEARPRLGDRLVGAGHITEEQLGEVLAFQKTLPERRRIGELLIERNMIDRDTMGSYVREQIADSVAAALSWTTGVWAFLDGEQVQEDVPLDMSVEDLLMEGSRRLEEFEVILQRLGSLDAVVDFVAGAATPSLTPDEWSMLTQIDGMSSVRDIAEASGYGQFEAARIIYGLLTAGVVNVLVEEGSEEPEPPVEHVERPETPAPPVPEPGPATDGDRAYSFSAELADLQNHPAAPPAAEPEPGPERRAEPEPAAAVVDRNQLLREFGGLFGDDDDERPPASTPVPPPPARAPVPPPPDPNAGKKGFLDRFRKG